MKLPEVLTKFLRSQSKPKELFLTLLLDSDYVSGACWSMGVKTSAELIHAVARRIHIDDWKERITAADQVIAALEERSGSQEIHKVIFGLPITYLNRNGDIEPQIRLDLKKLTKELDLEAIGFVPVHQAIIFNIKRDEGVPPTVILIGVSGKHVNISLYKIGTFIGSATVEKDEHVIERIEKVFKSFLNVEVLPSRILLYGVVTEVLESFKTSMMQHPWPTHTNFLHFPKIDILPSDFVVDSVSLAGANELANTMKEEEHEEQLLPAGDKTDVQKTEEQSESETASHEENLPHETENVQKHEEVLKESEKYNEKEYDEEAVQGDYKNDEDDSKKEDRDSKEDANVTLVEPEVIGFKSNVDVIVEQEELNRSYLANQQSKKIKKPEIIQPSGTKWFLSVKAVVVSILSKISIPHLLSSKGKTLPFKALLPVIGIIVLALGIMLYMLLSQLLPQANVAIVVIPQSMSESVTLTIDPAVTQINKEQNIIPGKKLEKNLVGEKTISVTGKKKVGDPARGNVIIYNKTLSTKTLSKGTILTSGSLKFTLDDSVQIASATESIGSITFGKNTTAISASLIGSESNLPSGSEFELNDISAASMIARNDQALTGGTSRDVNVVTRSDYDNLVKLVTNDIVAKAKGELSASISAGLTLIDDTLKTTVSKKEFSQELDEESDQLHGVVTMSVSVIGYAKDDVKNLIDVIVGSKVPAGYVLSKEKATVDVKKLQVQKNNKISAEISWNGVALPSIDVENLRNLIAGKTLDAAQAELKKIPGIAEANISFSRTFNKNRLPKQPSHITITISMKQ